jgi:hypothetical protein
VGRGTGYLVEEEEGKEDEDEDASCYCRCWYCLLLLSWLIRICGWGCVCGVCRVGREGGREGGRGHDSSDDQQKREHLY